MDTIVPEPDTAIWWQRRDLKTVAVFKKPKVEFLFEEKLNSIPNPEETKHRVLFKDLWKKRRTLGGIKVGESIDTLLTLVQQDTLVTLVLQ